MRNTGFVLFLLFATVASSASQRRIAVTVDDLPVALIHRHTAEDHEVITDRLLATFRKHDTPAVGFVNESKLMAGGELDPARLALLERWLDASHELGNHGFDHLDLHAVDPELWMADVLRGERHTRPLVEAHRKELRWFRHPFLRTGRSVDVQHRTGEFLKSRGYRIAPVTIDNDEWLYGRAYTAAWKRGDAALMKRIGEDYVRYMLEVVDHYEKQSRLITGELIPQVLLIHAYALNADWLDPLLEELEERGYEWITLDEAMRHPAYRSDTHGYTGPRGPSWLHRWALTAGKDPESLQSQPEAPRWIDEIR